MRHTVDVKSVNAACSAMHLQETLFILPTLPFQQRQAQPIDRTEEIQCLELEPRTSAWKRRSYWKNKLRWSGTSSSCKKQLRTWITSSWRHASTWHTMEVVPSCSIKIVSSLTSRSRPFTFMTSDIPSRTRWLKEKLDGWFKPRVKNHCTHAQWGVLLRGVIQPSHRKYVSMVYVPFFTKLWAFAPRIKAVTLRCGYTLISLTSSMVTTNREKGTSNGYFSRKGLRHTNAAKKGARQMRTKATVHFRPERRRPFAYVTIVHTCNAAPMSTFEETQNCSSSSPPVARTFFCTWRVHSHICTSSCACTYTHGSGVRKGLLHVHVIDLHLAFSVSCLAHLCGLRTTTLSRLSRPHSPCRTYLS